MEHDSTTSDNEQLRDDSNYRKWQATLGGSTLQSDPTPDQIIIDGPNVQLPEDLSNEEYRQLFFQAMEQGIATSNDGSTHFFRPKSFLQGTDHEIFRTHAKYDTFARGLNSIVETKNLPGNQDNPSLQDAAKSAIYEYLDPKLFKGNVYIHSELVEIYALLDTKARNDPVLNQCLVEADNYRNNLIRQYQEEAYKKAGDDDREARLSEKDSSRIDHGTTIKQIRDQLRKSSSPVAFERINALEQWRDFIEQNLPTADLEEAKASFVPVHHAPGTRPNYPENNDYAVIAFNYGGQRCMIAECCNTEEQGSSSAAMKIWCGSSDNRQGWEFIFDHTKEEADLFGFCQSIRHPNLAAEVAESKGKKEDHIVEAEDRLFRIAFHFFETGELLNSSKKTTKELDKIIGPEFRRPNPE